MNLLTIDYETYFDNDYTLSKVTTEGYVRDPRYKTHMLGVSGLRQLGFDQDSACLRHEQIKTGKDSAFTGCALLAQHAHFDGLILSHHYGVTPAFWFDTKSMHQLLFPHKRHSLAAMAEQFGLPAKTVPYNDFKGVRDLPPALYKNVAAGCLQDLELTYAIFKKMLPFIPRSELKIIDLTVRMFTEPVLRLDRDKLTQYLAQTREEKDDLLAAAGVTREDVGSAEKFAALLRSFGVEPPTKISKTTGKASYAFAKTDSALKELQDHEDDMVQALVAARLGIKSNMVETRAQRMLDMDTRGAMCVYLSYAKAHTHRWAGADKMNWQNFKRKSVIREAVLAPEGYEVCVIDAAQIEYRLTVWLARQMDMMERLRRKEDIYSEVATRFYGEFVDKGKPDKRGTGKQIVLSCGFRAGWQSIQNTARLGLYGPPVILTDDQAKTARNLYRTMHPGVVQLWKFGDDTVLPALFHKNADFEWGPMRVEGDKIYIPDGTYLDYSNLGMTFDENGKVRYFTQTQKGRKDIHGGIVLQNVIEALARAILVNAMLIIAPHYRIVTCTHDEIVYLAPAHLAEEAVAFGLSVLRQPLAWCPDIPLDAEGGHDRNYSK